MIETFLETGRLILRRVTEADADALYRLDEDPEVMRFLTGGRPTPRDVITNETLPRMLRSYELREGFGYLTAVEKSTGKFLGWFALCPKDGGEPGEVELGYRLRRSAWGQGYATEGSRALIREGFTSRGVRRVVAETMAVNRASRRVMEKAGLTHVRTFHKDWPDPIPGVELGEVEYALTKADWERQEEEKEKEEWDGIFSRLGDELGSEDPWLERWRSLLEDNREAPVLDLGCGAGDDAGTLTRWNFRVVAADYSEKALQATGRRAPEAKTKNVDLTRGLPFAGSSFGAVIASLSLHYFPWQKTEEILNDVRRCLIPGGRLLARFNSTNDAHYAAARKEEIEPNYYLVDGHPKRLFDRRDVDTLFAHGWQLESAAERTTNRYGNEKTLWEIVARKQQ